MNKIAALVAGLCLLLSNPTHAQTYTWDGGGADNFWNNSTNWAGDPSPLAFTSVITANTNGVVFSALNSLQSSNRLGQPSYINTLLFTNITSDFIINNVNTNNQVASLFFRGVAPRISVSSGVSNAVTFIGGPVETGNNFTIDHDGTGLLTFGALRSTASGGTNGVVTKLGSGTMVLSGSGNNFNGGLFIQGGAVRSSANAAGNYGNMFGSNSTGNALVTLQGGGLELYRSGNSTFSNNVVVQSNSTITSGRNTSAAGLNYRLDGTLSMGAQTLTINAANVNSGTAGVEFLGATTLTGNGTLLVTNNVAGVTTSLRLGAVNESGGSYGLTKAGTGLLTLTAAGNYSGGTTIQGGTLAVASDSFLGNGGDVGLAGGTWQITGSTAYDSARGISLTADSTLEVGNTAGATFSGLFSTTSISNVLTKTGGGALTLQPGSGQTNELGVLVVNDGSTITLAGGTTRLAGSSPNSVGPGLQLRSGSLILDGGNLVTTNAAFSGMTGATTLTILADSSYTSEGLFTLGFGNGGNGTLNLDGGAMTVNGQLRTVAATAGTTASATVNLDGGTLALNGFSDAATLGGATVFFNGATVRALANNALFANTGFTTYWVKSGGAVFDTDGRNITFGRALLADAGSPGGGLTKTGAGTLTLSGTNTYTGGTTLSGGLITMNASDALGTTGNITFSGGGLQFSANGTTDVSSRIKNSTSAVLLDTNAQNITFSSAIDGTNTGGLTKNGTGTLVLSGTNTYTGTTTINAGTLQANASGALGSTTNITVNGGSLLVTADDAIGNSTGIDLAGGTLEFSGNVTDTIGALTLSANSVIDLGTGSVVAIFADLFMGSYTLAVHNWTGTTQWEGGTGNNTDQIYFNRNLSSGELSRISFYSNFGSSFVGTGLQLGLGSGFQYQVIPVPEPETWVAAALLLVGASVAWGKGRRRREAA